MRILAVNPPFYRLQNEMYNAYPPGPCYVAATLRQAGFDPVVYNADYDGRRKTLVGNTNHLNVKALHAQKETYETRLKDPSDPIWREVHDKLVKYAPDVLIISVFNVTLTAGNRIAALAKELNPKVVTLFEGAFNIGIRSAVNPADAGDFSVMDVALRGEPEYSAVEVVQRLEAGERDLSGILGVSWRKADGTVVHNSDRAALLDLDALPFPARDAMEGWQDMMPHAFQSIFGSRGCPFQCVFCCCHVSMGRKLRVRSAENIFAEVEQVHRQFGTRYFFFCDDIFFVDRERALKFCDLVLRSRLPIFFTVQTRAEIADDEVLAMAKRAGCQHVAVGVEVGNPRIRDLLKKGNTVDDVRRCAKLVHKHGLRLSAFVLLGLPWEGREEIIQTVELVKEIKPYVVFPYMPTPGAGTELAQIMEQKNPKGLAKFRDVCHIDAGADVSERMSADERAEVLEWAVKELAALNRRNLLLDLLSRPRFYMSFMRDLGLFRHPRQLLSYVGDILGR